MAHIIPGQVALNGVAAGVIAVALREINGVFGDKEHRHGLAVPAKVVWFAKPFHHEHAGIGEDLILDALRLI